MLFCVFFFVPLRISELFVFWCTGDTGKTVAWDCNKIKGWKVLWMSYSSGIILNWLILVAGFIFVEITWIWNTGKLRYVCLSTLQCNCFIKCLTLTDSTDMSERLGMLSTLNDLFTLKMNPMHCVGLWSSA